MRSAGLLAMLLVLGAPASTWAQPELVAEPESESDPDPESESESESDPDPDPDPDPEPEPEPVAESESESESDPDPEPVAEPESESDPEPVAEPETEARPSRDRVHLGAGASVGVLNLPNLGIGATLYTQIAPRRFWPIELSATYFFDNHQELTVTELDLAVHPQLVAPFPSGGARGTFRSVELSAALCPYDRPLDSGRLFVCGGAYGGLLMAESEGLVLRDGEEQRPLFGFEAYVRWRFRLAGPLALTYNVGLFVPVLRDRFGYEDRFGQFRELFQVSAVGGRVGLMLVLEL